jgi:thiosulfate dehydrogenase [quinone] large subunit
MILAFIESIKYVGHMWPITLLRLFMAVQYFRMASASLQSGILEHPYISEQLRLKMESVGVFNSYFSMWNSAIQENWLIASYVIVCSQFVIGISYLFGYLVRPVSLWAAFLSLHLFWFVETQGDRTQLFAMGIHLMFCFIGAGRCLGVDAYFYKSRRGLLW